MKRLGLILAAAIALIACNPSQYNDARVILGKIPGGYSLETDVDSGTLVVGSSERITGFAWFDVKTKARDDSHCELRTVGQLTNHVLWCDVPARVTLATTGDLSYGVESTPRKR